MTSAKRPAGYCRVCQRRYRLRKDGTLGWHGDCQGEGLLPLFAAGWTAQPTRCSKRPCYNARPISKRDAR